MRRRVIAEARREASPLAPWYRNDAGNLVRAFKGLRIVVYRHATQGWSYLRSGRRSSYAAHGFPTEKAAAEASTLF